MLKPVKHRSWPFATATAAATASNRHIGRTALNIKDEA